MQTSHDQPGPAALVARASQRSHNPDRYYRVLGVALASGVSALFWCAVLAVALPAMSITPTATGLVLIGLSIASFVSASLCALRGNG